MGSVKTIKGICHVCGLETDHDIVCVYTKGIGFGFALECPACGKIVPEQAWHKYQKTGDVIVPDLIRNSRMMRGHNTYSKGTKNYQ